ncbi:MAG: hypothetical protein NVSMB31_01330 [Vulcanimicrobiaceae bacterium]
MSAAEYVVLAREVANKYFAHAWHYDIGARYLTVWANGQIFANFRLHRLQSSSVRRLAVLCCDLTPENTSSENALVRALLENAIQVHRYHTGGYWATISDENLSGLLEQTEDSAREALLQILLATDVEK